MSLEPLYKSLALKDKLSRRKASVAQTNGHVDGDPAVRATKWWPSYRSRLRNWQLLLCLSPFVVCILPFVITIGKTEDRDFTPSIFGPPPFCQGKLIYVYPLPPVYNTAFLKECSWLRSGQHLCHYMENGGLGRETDYGFSRGGPALGPPTGWYNTWEFSLEQYFFERFKRYPCRTENPKEASAFYVPYFASMDLWKRISLSEMKDELFLRLIAELQSSPWFTRHSGADHFLVLARPAGDFKHNGNWSNMMLFHPSLRKVIKLTPERSTSFGKITDDLEVGVPYPTYFHPASIVELDSQQDWLSQGVQRDLLVAMAAGPKRSKKAQLRTFLIRQCANSARCAMLHCVGPGKEDTAGSGPGHLNTYNRCDRPRALLDLFYRAEFCLQPPGDTFTRRSTFDAMLAGCIPVFTSKNSAHNQYFWHMPQKISNWAISIPDKVLGRRSVIDILKRISKRRKKVLRDNIKRYLPRMLYAAPWKRYPRGGYPSAAAVARRLARSQRANSTGGLTKKERAKQTAMRRMRSSKKVQMSVPEREVLDQPDAFDVALDAVLKLAKESIGGGGEMEGAARAREEQRLAELEDEDDSWSHPECPPANAGEPTPLRCQGSNATRVTSSSAEQAGGLADGDGRAGEGGRRGGEGLKGADEKSGGTGGVRGGGAGGAGNKDGKAGGGGGAGGRREGKGTRSAEEENAGEGEGEGREKGGRKKREGAKGGEKALQARGGGQMAAKEEEGEEEGDRGGDREDQVVELNGQIERLAGLGQTIVQKGRVGRGAREGKLKGGAVGEGRKAARLRELGEEGGGGKEGKRRTGRKQARDKAEGLDRETKARAVLRPDRDDETQEEQGT